MPPAKDRLTKEELHQDEFTASVFRFIGYAEQNYPKILAGIGAFVVILIIGYFILQSSNQRTMAALGAIGDVEVALMQGNTSSAITKAQNIIHDYSGEAVAGRAFVTLANIYYDQARFEEATSHYVQYLEVVEDHSGPEAYGAQAGIAAAMESQGNLSGAAQQYLRYSDTNGQTPFSPLALVEAARCFRAVGNVEMAKQLYTRIRADYASTPAARVAKTELEILGKVVD